jgi:hypothetical protein
MTPRAPARAWLPLLRFRPGGVGLGGATRGAALSVRDAWACSPVAVGGGREVSGRLVEVRNEILVVARWRIRLVAYGASLESWLGASPRGFESPILRKNADGASFKGAPSAFTEIARIR